MRGEESENQNLLIKSIAYAGLCKGISEQTELNFSSFSSLPVLLMIIIYFKIFSMLRRRGRPDPTTASSNELLLPEKEKIIEDGEFGREHWTIIVFLLFILVVTVGHFHKCLPVPKDPVPGKFTASKQTEL